MSNTCTKVEGLKLKRRVTTPRLYWEDLLPQEQRELDYYQEDGGLNFFRLYSLSNSNPQLRYRLSVG